MLLRVIQFIFGLAAAAGGGYLAWTNLDAAGMLAPPGPAGLPLVFLLGVLGLVLGLVFLVSALHPRPNQRRLREAKEAREDAALQQAEAYYSERSRAADRDWRAGDIRPLAPAATSPAPAEQPSPSAPTALFPSDATLAPVPRASEPPPAIARPAPSATPGPAPSGNATHAAIRTAIAAGRLDEAEQMLNAARESAAGLALAELTALAGDHAMAKGQQTHARWLWRLALKRFGENEATNSPAAHAVAESLRAVS